MMLWAKWLEAGGWWLVNCWLRTPSNWPLSVSLSVLNAEDIVRRPKLWLGIAISAFFLWWSFRQLEWSSFWVALREANYWWIIPGVVVYFGAVWARTWRWHYMLRHIKPVSLRRLFPVVVIGYMGNNVYPARAGEVIRSYVLKRKEGIGMGASLTTVILERLFDGLVMLFFVFVTLPFIRLPSGWNLLVIAASVLFGIALIVFFVLAADPQRTERLYGWFLRRIVPARFHGPAHAALDKIMLGLHSLRSPREVLMIFVTSTAIWLTETTKYWFVMHAFDFRVPFSVLMLMTAVANLALIIPAAPGGAGTFEIAGISVLKSFKVTEALATSYTVILHLALWIPITLLGFWYMWREQVAWNDFDQAMDESQEAEVRIQEREAALHDKMIDTAHPEPEVRV